MARRNKADDAARFGRRYAPAVVGDLAVLRVLNARLVDAALAALEDLAFGRQIGKLLGERHVTGDLSGLSRLRFDLPDQHPLRFRIVYRLIDNDTGDLPVIEVSRSICGAHCADSFSGPLPCERGPVQVVPRPPN